MQRNGSFDKPGMRNGNLAETTANTLTIKELSEDDFGQVPKIHKLAFPNSVLSYLGTKILMRYYRFLRHKPNFTICIGAFADKCLVGFCVSGVFKVQMGNFIQKNWPYLMIAFGVRPHLLFNELIIIGIRKGFQLLVNLAKKRKRAKAVPPKWSRPRFGIMSIAVDPVCRRRGIAKKLIDEVQRLALLNGFPDIRLTVRHENVEAIEFYLDSGWEKVKTNGMWQGLMEKTIGG